MRRDEYGRRAAGTIAAHGLSVADYFVLRAVNEATMTPEEVVGFATEASRGDAIGACTASQHGAALGRCIAGRLVHRITEEDCVIDTARWAATEYELCTLSAYFVGGMGLTNRGAAVLRRLDEELHEL